MIFGGGDSGGGGRAWLVLTQCGCDSGGDGRVGWYYQYVVEVGGE